MPSKLFVPVGPNPPNTPALVPVDVVVVPGGLNMLPVVGVNVVGGDVVVEVFVVGEVREVLGALAALQI